MDSRNRWVAGAIALAIAVIGLAVGLWPHSIRVGGTDSVSCGSAFSPNSDDAGPAALKKNVGDALAGLRLDLNTRTELLASCDDALGAPRTFALVLIGVGVLGAVGAGLARSAEPVGDQARAV